MSKTKIIVAIVVILIPLFALTQIYFFGNKEVMKKFNLFNSQADSSLENSEKPTPSVTQELVQNVPCSIEKTLQTSKSATSPLRIVSIPTKSEDGYFWYQHYLQTGTDDERGFTATCSADIGLFYNQLLEVFSPEIYQNYSPEQDRAPLKGVFDKASQLFYTVVLNKEEKRTLVSVNFETKEVNQIFSAIQQTDISIMEFYATSQGPTLLFHVYREPMVCGEGDCNTKLAALEAAICKEGVVGLWSYSTKTTKVNQIQKEDCHYTGG